MSTQRTQRATARQGNAVVAAASLVATNVGGVFTGCHHKETLWRTEGIIVGLEVTEPLQSVFIRVSLAE